jgi:prepilin-type N-terminal cleavage/methylation domain-containing protein
MKFRLGTSSYRGRASGFTLVELLVSLMASAILIGSLTVAVNAQSALAQRHRDMVIATAFANTKIEALRSAGFLGLTNGTTTITSELPSELKAPRSATLAISSYSTSVRKATLTLSYNDRGNTRTFSYSTFIGELGVGQY